MKLTRLWSPSSSRSFGKFFPVLTLLWVASVPVVSLSESLASSLIIEGTLAQTGEFEEVFALLIEKTHPNGIRTRAICSATLVHERLLITAAHCVDGKINVPLRALNRPDISGGKGGLDIEVESFGALPEWLSAPSPEKNLPYRQSVDIGYVVLKTPVKNVKPAKFYAPTFALQTKSLVGRPLTLVGYGYRTVLKSEAGRSNNGSSKDRRIKDFGVKSWSEGKIESYTRNRLHRSGLVGNTNSGDSGGAVYTQVGGQRRLVAVISSGTVAATTDETRHSYHAPLRRSHLCWIQESSEVPLGMKYCW